jgi:hypothetical protein
MEIWEPEMNLMIRDADEAHLKALLQEIQAHPGMKGEITGGNNTKTEQRPSTSSHSMEVGLLSYLLDLHPLPIEYSATCRFNIPTCVAEWEQTAWTGSKFKSDLTQGKFK